MTINPPSEKIIPYGRHEITEEDIAAVVEVLKSDFLTQGPVISSFEDNFSSFVGSKYCVAVTNGTAALHLACLALGLDEQSAIITTPITFVATANCGLYCGARVYFADIDPDTYLIDLNQVEDLLKQDHTRRIKAVLPVNLAGNPVHLEQLKDICERYDCKIIEDACHSPGAWFIDNGGKKQLSGGSSYSDMSIFSFHPVKHIATGEGGVVTTNSKTYFDNLQILRTHGITRDPKNMVNNHGGWYYEMQKLGYNYRMPDILAALGVSQLKRANQNIDKRKYIASEYDKLFDKYQIKRQLIKKDTFNSYHLYIIEHELRDEMYSFLRTMNIYCQVHYIPVHLQPFYQNLGWKTGDFPNAERYYQRCLSLPMYSSLKTEELNYVLNCCEPFINSHL